MRREKTVLTPSEDHYRPFEVWRTSRLAAKSQQLSNGRWHLIGFGICEHCKVETPRSEEAILVAAHVGPCEISRWEAAESRWLVKAR